MLPNTESVQYRFHCQSIGCEKDLLVTSRDFINRCPNCATPYVDAPKEEKQRITPEQLQSAIEPYKAVIYAIFGDPATRVAYEQAVLEKLTFVLEGITGTLQNQRALLELMKRQKHADS